MLAPADKVVVALVANVSSDKQAVQDADAIAGLFVHAIDARAGHSLA